MTTKQVVLLIFYVGVAICQQTPIGSCPDGSPTPTSIEIHSPLDTLCTENSCKVYGGTSISINFTFVSNDFIQTLKPRVFALAAEVTIEWPGLAKDGCSLLTTSTCPIVPDEPVGFYQTIDVADIFPEISVHLTYVLQDADAGKNVTCFTYDIVVDNSKDSLRYEALKAN